MAGKRGECHLACESQKRTEQQPAALAHARLRALGAPFTAPAVSSGESRAALQGRSQPRGLACSTVGLGCVPLYTTCSAPASFSMALTWPIASLSAMTCVRWVGVPINQCTKCFHQHGLDVAHRHALSHDLQRVTGCAREWGLEFRIEVHDTACAAALQACARHTNRLAQQSVANSCAAPGCPALPWVCVAASRAGWPRAGMGARRAAAMRRLLAGPPAVAHLVRHDERLLQPKLGDLLTGGLECVRAQQAHCGGGVRIGAKHITAGGHVRGAFTCAHAAMRGWKPCPGPLGSLHLRAGMKKA